MILTIVAILENSGYLTTSLEKSGGVLYIFLGCMSTIYANIRSTHITYLTTTAATTKVEYRFARNKLKFNNLFMKFILNQRNKF